MSPITISDLPSSTSLDRDAMSSVRGGHAWGSPNVNVTLNVHQQIAQAQDIDVRVLNNNGTIGAGFTGPRISLAPTQKAVNNAILPKFF